MNDEVIEVLTQEVNDKLLAQIDLLEQFRHQLVHFFKAVESAKGGTPFRRRPNISLRLVADGEPAAKLVALPGWDKRRRTLRVTHLQCELFVEEHRVVKGEAACNLKCVFGAAANDTQPWRYTRLNFRTGKEDLDRFLSTVRSFVQERQAVLARSHDSCCICGRPLTDGLSQARGIGPECIKYCAELWFREGSGAHLVQPASGIDLFSTLG